MDPYEFLHITCNPDGSLTRDTVIPLVPPTTDDPSAPALSKDVPLNPAHNTWLRLFHPRDHPPASSKLPVVFYFHGGGFVFYSAATAPIHANCVRMAAELPAVVLSVEYRLAPEHRLPAAYDDAADALLWARDTTDPWLEHVDWSRCYLTGSSAGANVAYHAALRAPTLELGRLKLAGLVLNHPYFGGVERTESEVRLADDRILPLAATDLMWELALPLGAGRDHEYCNVMRTPPPVGVLPKRCLVRGHAGDPLIDRQREAARVLEGVGVEVVANLGDEGCHGAEIFRPDKLAALLVEVKEFVCGSSDGVGLPPMV